MKHGRVERIYMQWQVRALYGALRYGDSVTPPRGLGLCWGWAWRWLGKPQSQSRKDFSQKL